MTQRRRLLGTLMLIASVTAAKPAAGQAPEPAFAGSWEGTLTAGQTRIDLVFDIARASDGVYLGTVGRADQPRRTRLDRVDVKERSISLGVSQPPASFTGLIEEDGSRIRGTWAQGGMTYPLDLTRREASPASSVNAPPSRANLIALPLELMAPLRPVPFHADGRVHLVYELHITNLGVNELSLQRVEVLSGGATLVSLAASELNSSLARPGTRSLTDNRVVGPGLRAIAYIWISLSATAQVPRSLRHRVTGSDDSIEGGVVVVESMRVTTLSPPLRGVWQAGAGPANTSPHRRQFIPLLGAFMIAQRFAIDWIRVSPDGTTSSGDPRENRSYLAYGEEVLAVADAVVASTQDGIPENVPGAGSRAVPITIANTGGNFINLDLGGGRFAHYAHLQPGTLRVKPGDRVRRGQVLGLVGNSGNSDQPHLHFHVGTADSGLAAEGLPYTIDRFEVLNASGAWEQRMNELPLQRAFVRFPK